MEGCYDLLWGGGNTERSAFLAHMRERSRSIVQTLLLKFYVSHMFWDWVQTSCSHLVSQMVIELGLP